MILFKVYLRDSNRHPSPAVKILNITPRPILPIRKAWLEMASDNHSRIFTNLLPRFSFYIYICMSLSSMQGRIFSLTLGSKLEFTILNMDVGGHHKNQIVGNPPSNSPGIRQIRPGEFAGWNPGCMSEFSYFEILRQNSKFCREQRSR